LTERETDYAAGQAVGEPERLILAAEERDQLMRALATLPPIDKELVYRRYFLYESVEQIAADLGLSRQAADNRLWRTRKALRIALTEGGLREVSENGRK
jgi:RNA polymerase sigma-70 factor (ECF subfamily)